MEIIQFCIVLQWHLPRELGLSNKIMPSVPTFTSTAKFRVTRNRESPGLRTIIKSLLLIVSNSPVLIDFFKINSSIHLIIPFKLFSIGNNSLIISGSESSDSGIYRCEAINLIGESTSQINLAVDGKNINLTQFDDWNLIYLNRQASTCIRTARIIRSLPIASWLSKRVFVPTNTTPDSAASRAHWPVNCHRLGLICSTTRQVLATGAGSNPLLLTTSVKHLFLFFSFIACVSSRFLIYSFLLLIIFGFQATNSSVSFSFFFIATFKLIKQKYAH